jgi:hypothetical protein
MEEIQRLAGLAFVYGLVMGGALAQLVGDVLLLVTGAIALGSFGGAAYGWHASRHASPWQDDRALRTEAAANGALVGGVFGLIAAMVDALAGG